MVCRSKGIPSAYLCRAGDIRYRSVIMPTRLSGETVRSPPSNAGRPTELAANAAMTVPRGTANKGKGPIRANGKGLVFSRRAGDALSKNFANLRRDSSTLGEEIHPRACVTRTISGRECPCGHSLPHRSAQSVLSVRTCRSASGGFRVSSRGGLSASRGGCRVRVV